MSKNAWLTKNSIPAGRVSCVLTLPADGAWRADFLGAFLLLAKEENWEAFETLTPAEMADEWLDVFLEFERECLPVLPVATILPFAGQTAPSGFLMCHGQTVLREDYPLLYNEIGLIYGVYVSDSEFDIPDLRQRIPLGAYTGLGVPWEIGDMGGELNHTLTLAEMPSHTHPTPAQFRTGAVTGNAVNHEFGDSSVTATGGPATGATGGGGAHNNMPPYLVLNYIIKT